MTIITWGRPWHRDQRRRSRNRGAEYVSESGVKRMRGSARQSNAAEREPG
jgi:hypothetical protein